MSAPFTIRQSALGCYRITVVKLDEPHQLRPYQVALLDCLRDTTHVQSNFSTEAAAVHLAHQLERAIEDGTSFGPPPADFSDCV